MNEQLNLNIDQQVGLNWSCFDSLIDEKSRLKQSARVNSREKISYLPLKEEIDNNVIEGYSQSQDAFLLNNDSVQEERK